MITKIIIDVRVNKLAKGEAETITEVDIVTDKKGELITKTSASKVLVDALQIILDHKE
jgi:hypothetical protein